MLEIFIIQYSIITKIYDSMSTINKQQSMEIIEEINGKFAGFTFHSKQVNEIHLKHEDLIESEDLSSTQDIESHEDSQKFEVCIKPDWKSINTATAKTNTEDLSIEESTAKEANIEDKAEDKNTKIYQNEPEIYKQVLSCFKTVKWDKKWPKEMKAQEVWQYYHSDIDKRRKPIINGLLVYNSQLCENIKDEKAWMKGDQWEFWHSKTEVNYHPANYKTIFCDENKYGKCELGEVCFKFHSKEMRRDGSHYIKNLPSKPKYPQIHQMKSGGPQNVIWRANKNAFSKVKSSSKSTTNTNKRYANHRFESNNK